MIEIHYLFILLLVGVLITSICINLTYRLWQVDLQGKDAITKLHVIKFLTKMARDAQEKEDEEKVDKCIEMIFEQIDK